MSNKINSVKEKLINDYIKKIDMAIDNYNLSIEPDEEIVNLLIEIVNVFENDIPNLQGSLLISAGGGNCADRADLSIILQAEAATCGLCLFCNSATSFP